jgi:homeobox protein engrailed
VPQPISLPFSVANILRPDFGRRAVITSKQHESLYRPGAIRRTVTPICDYHTLYRPHEHLPGVQPLPAPKPTKAQHSAWSPVTATRAPSLPDDNVSCKVTTIHQHARSKELQLSVPSSGTASPPLSPASSTVSASSSAADDKALTGDSAKGPQLWPAWVYCTRYSDRPSSGESLSLCLLDLKHHPCHHIQHHWDR